MKSRKKSYKAGEETKEKLLDYAEYLFSQNGFEGTSVRDIAKEVGVQLAAVSYHFGGKDNLFEQVIARRAAQIGELRLKALNDAGSQPSIEDLVKGYTLPFIEQSVRGGEGWRNYSRLIAGVANSPKWTFLITRYYDEVAKKYLTAFRTLLPNSAAEEVVNGFDFMVGTMLTVCAETRRMEALADLDQRALEEIFPTMLRFLVGGFEALSPRQAE